VALTEKDLRKALAFLHGLQVARDERGLIHHVVSSLPTLISADTTAFSEVNLVAGTMRWVGHPPDRVPEVVIGPHVHQIAESCVAHHPMVRWYRRARSGKATQISDVIIQPRFRDLRVYQEFYRPLGIEDQLSIRFPRPRHLMASLAIGRSKWRFTDRERELLDLLRPHLVGAFDNAKAWERVCGDKANLEDALASIDIGTVVLASNGRIEETSSKAAAYLADFFSPSSLSALPGELHGWLRHQELTCRATLEPLKPYCVEQNAARLVVRAVKLGESRVLLLLERRTMKPDRAALAGLGLTQRELDVLSLVVQDRQITEIARMLKASVRTVDKHLEHIYRKLGVRSRFEAITRARDGKRAVGPRTDSQH
jgi:DNA-binding CsgD family transcriptional regulator